MVQNHTAPTGERKQNEARCGEPSHRRPHARPHPAPRGGLPPAVVCGLPPAVCLRLLVVVSIADRHHCASRARWLRRCRRQSRRSREQAATRRLRPPRALALAPGRSIVRGSAWAPRAVAGVGARGWQGGGEGEGSCLSALMAGLRTLCGRCFVRRAHGVEGPQTTPIDSSAPPSACCAYRS